MSAQETINKQFDEFKQTYHTLTAMAEFLPKELAEQAKTDLIFRDLKITIPFDIATFRKTRKLLGRGWKLKQVWGEKHYKNYSYTHPAFGNVEFWISLNITKEGSTCRLEEVGEKTEKVYKVVCS